MQTDASNQPKLGPPGAGLPFPEWAFAKFIIIPYWFATRDKQRAVEIYRQESLAIMPLVEPLTEQQLSERRLVPKLRGLEDNSRYWSVAMALEHLIIVGSKMHDLVVELAAGHSRNEVVTVQSVKPKNAVPPQLVVNAFRGMYEKSLVDYENLQLPEKLSAKFKHPWFGDLNAHGWLVFAGVHQGIHRNQIEEIIKLL
jgi:hypothetical protein